GAAAGVAAAIFWSAAVAGWASRAAALRARTAAVASSGRRPEVSGVVIIVSWWHRLADQKWSVIG
ncbi:hypothetical protein, partial [Microvirga sp. G4-2]|uniref:hypothetical protein n=1 Tax=Microvirga sp. G4-2 TaxID=3434467 RepID=UPI0040449AB1